MDEEVDGGFGFNSDGSGGAPIGRSGQEVEGRRGGARGRSRRRRGEEGWPMMARRPFYKDGVGSMGRGLPALGATRQDEGG
jgi:hypothetical protein